MTALAIEARGIGKEYVLGSAQPKSLRELIPAITSGLRVNGGANRAEPARKWALRNVDFDVREGEVLGIIGRNGSGKSTLLKILSRLTEPTTGTVRLVGRVGALLEVGTGFHPELTGRENIYINGAVLGMRRQQIEAKFDQIVDFAGVERFLETPVKRYSSGMRLRLGFAVAAHLEPEILLVDEVLAVGDAEFQKKCLGRINEVSNEGRTVLFVSHQLETVLNLCPRSIWLSDGRIQEDGETQDVIADYLRSIRNANETTSLGLRADRQGNGAVRVVDMYAASDTGDRLSCVATGQNVTLVLRYVAKTPNAKPVVNIYLRDQLSRHVTTFSTDSVSTGRHLTLSTETGLIRCAVPHLPLTPGVYHADISIKLNGDTADRLQYAFTLEVEPGDFFGTGRILSNHGLFVSNHVWAVSDK